MADHRADLERVVERLEQVYEDRRADLAERFSDPDLVTDEHGHYILLDALTAIVAARTALLGLDG